MRDEVLDVINDDDDNNSLGSVVIVDRINTRNSVDENNLPVMTEMDDDLKLGENLHMKLPEKADEVDMHFNNIISNLDYKITAHIEKQSLFNTAITNQVNQISDKAEAGEYAQN